MMLEHRSFCQAKLEAASAETDEDPINYNWPCLIVIGCHRRHHHHHRRHNHHLHHHCHPHHWPADQDPINYNQPCLLVIGCHHHNHPLRWPILFV